MDNLSLAGPENLEQIGKERNLSRSAFVSGNAAKGSTCGYPGSFSDFAFSTNASAGPARATQPVGPRGTSLMAPFQTHGKVFVIFFKDFAKSSLKARFTLFEHFASSLAG